MSMKQSITWHEKCLENQVKTIEKKMEEYNRLGAEIKRDLNGANIYKDQIQLAKEKGLDSFDAHRFGIRKRV
jgi:hypothetical protein